jgi:hypothetical protein
MIGCRTLEGNRRRARQLFRIRADPGRISGCDDVLQSHHYFDQPVVRTRTVQRGNTLFIGHGNVVDWAGYQGCADDQSNVVDKMFFRRRDAAVKSSLEKSRCT